jgi:type I restriction enzyme M protein
MNMILHGIERPNIHYADTLSKGFLQKPEYDVVLANPPFAGSIDKGDISDSFRIETPKTELLYLQLFLNLLRIGGKGVVIIPNGVLSRSSNAHKKARQMLLETCELQAVISMPAGIFRPYSGVGTGVLVFAKGGKTDNVWFYEMRGDGYSLDDKREFIDGQGDIPDILEKFRKEKLESTQCVIVSISEIKKNDYNLSFSRYKQADRDETQYEEPVVLIENISRLEQEIARELEELKARI